MASHRKSRTALLSAPGPRTAIGITTAALATVTLLSETASAAPAKPAQPSIAEVKAKVDSLQHQAEVATEKYNGIKEKTDQQSATVNKLLTQAAQKTQALNDTRRVLGQYAAAQYRTGDDSTSRYLLSTDPQQLVDQLHLTDVLSKRQKQAVESYQTQQAAATQKRIEAAKSLQALTSQQAKLKAAKKDVQDKLGQTQKLLNHFEITTPTVSYHLHNEGPRAEELLTQLKQGVRIAVVSDAVAPAPCSAGGAPPSGVLADSHCSSRSRRNAEMGGDGEGRDEAQSTLRLARRQAARRGSASARPRAGHGSAVAQ